MYNDKAKNDPNKNIKLHIQGRRLGLLLDIAIEVGILGVIRWNIHNQLVDANTS